MIKGAPAEDPKCIDGEAVPSPKLLFGVRRAWPSAIREESESGCGEGSNCPEGQCPARASVLGGHTHDWPTNGSAADERHGPQGHDPSAHLGGGCELQGRVAG